MIIQEPGFDFDWIERERKLFHVAINHLPNTTAALCGLPLADLDKLQPPDDSSQFNCCMKCAERAAKLVNKFMAR
jgi:hypothetical protein